MEEGRVEVLVALLRCMWACKQHSNAEIQTPTRALNLFIGKTENAITRLLTTSCDLFSKHLQDVDVVTVNNETV